MGLGKLLGIESRRKARSEAWRAELLECAELAREEISEKTKGIMLTGYFQPPVDRYTAFIEEMRAMVYDRLALKGPVPEDIHAYTMQTWRREGQRGVRNRNQQPLLNAFNDYHPDEICDSAIESTVNAAVMPINDEITRLVKARDKAIEEENSRFFYGAYKCDNGEIAFTPFRQKRPVVTPHSFASTALEYDAKIIALLDQRDAIARETAVYAGQTAHSAFLKLCHVFKGDDDTNPVDRTMTRDEYQTLRRAVGWLKRKDR